MAVLVPMPIKPGLHPALKEKCLHNLEQLSTEGGIEFDTVFDEREYPKQYAHENFFGRLARMRQQLIDDHLRLEHTDVLWIDADIIVYPHDLYQQLRRVSEEHVVSPIVLIEKSEINYDTASFREDVRARSSAGPPWFVQPGPVVELVSTGCCLVMPAEVHRQQRFRAQPDTDVSWNTEWLSMCTSARSMGYKILCDTRIRVEHANLPAYGEQFH
jgi:Anp1